MRLLRICVYWLLLSPLLGISGCTGGPIKAVTSCDVSTQKCHVTINSDCSATPDRADVPVGYTVIWDPPPSNGHSYSATFAATPFYFSSTYSVPVGPPGKKVTGNLLCNNLTVWALTSTSACYFSYTLYKENNKKCSDPGIHVVN
jgi:hypothetical protein